MVVCPANHCDPVDDRIPLYLGRARAFGSGLHETTVSCLVEMEDLVPFDDMTVLDVGCGTGILSMAALLLGAKAAVAFDIDPEAARACAANARLNGLQDRLRVYCGAMGALKGEALGKGAQFDLILANVYGDIILDLAPKLAAHLKKGGTVLLSGIGFEDMTDIRRTFRKLGLEQVNNRILEDYVTMIWKKSAPRSL